jgi:NAD(P)-dependent dehydrogenase (short-subunit alcohol dehydrogenase family)
MTSPAPARTALLTGATRGIGRHLALGLAGAGLDVALLGRDAAALDEVVAEAQGAGVRVAGVLADVTDLAGVERAVAEAELALGRIDLLVNNAGRIESGEVPPWETDPDEWWSVFEVNVRGPYNVARTVVPGMLAHGGGRIVDINSGAALRDGDIYSAYNASKAALFRVGAGFHDAGFACGLRVFELAPGVVRTDMTGSMGIHEDRTDWTDPREVVRMVLALASGDLDAWSGKFIRTGADDIERLRAAGARGLDDDARRLRLRPWGPDDPLAQ